MKTITKYLQEGLKSNEIPKVGQIAVDYSGFKWEIIDFAQKRDKAKLKSLLDEYDTGSCAEIIDDYDEDDYFVAAVMCDDERDFAVFLWAPEGLWYE